MWLGEDASPYPIYLTEHNGGQGSGYACFVVDVVLDVVVYSVVDDVV